MSETIYYYFRTNSVNNIIYIGYFNNKEITVKNNQIIIKKCMICNSTEKRKIWKGYTYKCRSCGHYFTYIKPNLELKIQHNGILYSKNYKFMREISYQIKKILKERDKFNTNKCSIFISI